MEKKGILPLLLITLALTGCANKPPNQVSLDVPVPYNFQQYQRDTLPVSPVYLPPAIASPDDTIPDSGPAVPADLSTPANPIVTGPVLNNGLTPVDLADGLILPELLSPVSSLPSAESPGLPNLDSINQAIDSSTGTKNSFNNYNLKFYMDGKNAYPALEEMLSTAKESIYFEVFQFHNDATGNRIADILSKKAQQGIKVYFLYDFLGNLDTTPIRKMQKSGVICSAYNKTVISTKGINITHRKVYIVDGEKAMTGGMNIGDDYAFKWHDSLTAYEGESVKVTLAEFINDWKLSGKKSDDFMTKDAAKTFIPLGSKPYTVRVAVTSPKENSKKTQLQEMMIAAVDSARNNIKVAMPFFYDDDFINHLISARKRGVQVSVFIPQNSKTKIINDLAVNASNKLIKGNALVYKTASKEDAYTHAKILTVDGTWATLGSCNADFRAFHNNQEFNIAVSDAEFTQEVNKVFFDTLTEKSDKAEYKNIKGYQKPYYELLEKIDNLF